METWKIIALIVAVPIGILMLLVVLGAVSYFGVLQPDNLLPDRCTTPPEFSCGDYGVSDSEFFVELENNMDSPITFESFTAESPGVDFGECSVPGELASSESARISCSVPSGSFEDSVRIDASFSYAREGDSFPRQARMDVFVSQ